MTTQTPEERLALVESIIQDTHVAYCALKKDRDRERDHNEPRLSRSQFDGMTGKIRAYGMVLDAFTNAGFDIGTGE